MDPELILDDPIEPPGLWERWGVAIICAMAAFGAVTGFVLGVAFALHYAGV